jgi:hypothetical protein
MKVKELPDDERHMIHEYMQSAGIPGAGLDNLTIEEVKQISAARLEDLDRGLARKQKLRQLKLELENILAPVEAKHPGLPLNKAVYFLSLAGTCRRFPVECWRDRPRASDCTCRWPGGSCGHRPGSPTHSFSTMPVASASTAFGRDHAVDHNLCFPTPLWIATGNGSWPETARLPKTREQQRRRSVRNVARSVRWERLNALNAAPYFRGSKSVRNARGG